MSRYIDTDKLNYQYLPIPAIGDQFITKSAIDNMPEEDVAKVKHGEWLLEREPDGKPYCFHCSVCDADFGRISIMSATPFCPWCGAKMDLKEVK